MQDSDADATEHVWLTVFRDGKYKECRLLLEKELENFEKRRHQITSSAILNNIAVCRYMELSCTFERPNVELIKTELKKLILNLQPLPSVSIDLRLVTIFNYLWLFWLEVYHPNSSVQIALFEEQLSVILPNMSRVLLDSPVESDLSRLDQIKALFQLSDTNFQYLDHRQAILVNAIKLLVGTASQDEFLSKITFLKLQDISIPHYLLHETKDRCNNFPLLLLPILHGLPTDLVSLDYKKVTISLNIVLAALLSRIKNYKQILTILPENHENLNLRALSIYIKAWCLAGDKKRLQANEVLSVNFTTKEGREGNLGCRGRILQANLEAQIGKYDIAVNVLRQAAKFHGSNWVLLYTLANLYKQLKQIDQYLRTMELLLQCLKIVEQRSSSTFEDKILNTMHKEKPIPVIELLYNLSLELNTNMRFEEASKYLLQLLAYADEKGWDKSANLPSRNTVISVASLALFCAGKVEEAGTVISQNSYLSLQEIKKYPISILLSAKIKMTSENFKDAIEDINKCVSILEEANNMTELEAKCHLLRAQCAVALGDMPNAKHSYMKSLLVSKGQRETLLAYFLYLNQKGLLTEAKRVWWDLEEQHPKVEKRTNIYTDPVLHYLMIPCMTTEEAKNAEEQVKLLLVKS